MWRKLPINTLLLRYCNLHYWKWILFPLSNLLSFLYSSLSLFLLFILKFWHLCHKDQQAGSQQADLKGQTPTTSSLDCLEQNLLTADDLIVWSKICYKQTYQFTPYTSTLSIDCWKQNLLYLQNKQNYPKHDCTILFANSFCYINY